MTAAHAAREAAVAARRERRVGLACAVAVLFVWVGFLLSSRLSAKQAFTPWDVLALRHAGAFLTVLPIVLWRGLPRVSLGRAAALTLFAGFGFPLLAYAGFGLAPVAHGAVMLPGALPFVTAALWAAALHEPWTRRRVVSLGVAAVGIGLLALDTFGDYPGAWRGDVLFLGGSVCWAVYMLLVRVWRVPALDATLAVALCAAPVTLPVWWLWLPSNLSAIPVGAMAYQLVYQGALAVVVAGFLFTRAMVALGATATSTITSVTPALAALAAWPLLDEPLGAVGLVGVALVTAAVAVAVGGAAAGRRAAR